MSSKFVWPRTAACVAALAITAPFGAYAAPISLSEALDRAQASSPSIGAAEGVVAAAQGRAQQAGFAPNPEASIEVEDVGGSGPYRGLRSAEATLSVGQRFELGGKRRARAVAAEAEIEVARLRLAVARADLASDVRTRFAETIAARERLAVARAAAERAQELSRMADVLVDAGREPPLRSLRARTAAQEAASAVAAAEADLVAAQRSLTTLWGAPDENPEPVAEERSTALPLPDPGESLEVRLAAAELAAARAAVDRERALATPDVTVQAGIRRYDSDDTAFVVGASMPIPIRDRNQGNVSAARADAVSAEARRNLAFSAAIQRTRDSQARLTTADTRVDLLESRIIPEAEEALRLAQQGFQAGRFALLDVLDAEAALNQAQTDLAEARLARAQAEAALLRAAAR